MSPLDECSSHLPLILIKPITAFNRHHLVSYMVEDEISFHKSLNLFVQLKDNKAEERKFTEVLACCCQFEFERTGNFSTRLLD